MNLEYIITELQSGNVTVFIFIVFITTAPIFAITFRNLQKYLQFYNHLVKKGAIAPEKAIVYEEAVAFFKRRIRSSKVSAIKFDEASKVWADTNAMKWTKIRLTFELPIVLFFLFFLILAIYY